jgi:hypothetical protein
MLYWASSSMETLIVAQLVKETFCRLLARKILQLDSILNSSNAYS